MRTPCRRDFLYRGTRVLIFQCAYAIIILKNGGKEREA